MLFVLAYLLVVRAFRSYVKKKELEKPKLFKTTAFNIFSRIFAIFMVVDIIAAFVTIKFWSERHYGNPVDTKIETLVESHYDDEYMQNRFVEWKFLA